ncbi:Protein Daple [Pseudolycoriella hygida]|uniref:Protein Daple n=1 Tax=Pseudolycoriella hygida TaxID=35572 RepID=A0A9Q0MQZ3_9DIPT|nr:Protein Daple [Pseudolycoriella hygida]
MSEMSATESEVEEFLNGALLSWLESCLPRPEILTGYQSLLDGTILHSVWLQIDPEPQNHPTKLENIDDLTLANARAKNFDIIVKNLKALYEEELNQTVLVLPDCSILGHKPESRVGLEQMKLLITLLLGAAVQCPNKQLFIVRIKELNVSTQHAIVELIKQVTDNQTLVLTNDSLEQLTPPQMYQHIIRIAKERDRYHSNWITSLMNETDSRNCGNVSNSTPANDNNHLAVELANLKSKLRKFRQELEEKSEAYIEVKEELDHKISQYDKLRADSQEWYTESRRAAAYRDEVDVLRERADRADRLEIDVQRFREKLSDAEFFKTRVEELREDNRMLLETKEMLEEQLQRSRKRSEHVMDLESEIIKYKQKLNDMASERDADKTRLQELVDENTQLQFATKDLCSSTVVYHSEEECTSGDNSLSEQLTNNAQTRALKLELENRRLQQTLDAMKESSFHEYANKHLELEKEKKKLSLKVDQLQENCNRLVSQNKELENVFRDALEENKKLQDAIDHRQQANDRQAQEREIDRMKLIDLEKHAETLLKEKQRIQNLYESVQRRAADLERSVDGKSKEIDELRTRTEEFSNIKEEVFELRNKNVAMERETVALSKEVTKLRENIEKKDVTIDRQSSELEVKEKLVQSLNNQVESSSVNLERLQELETKNTELVSQIAINTETISTLQRDLVSGTIATKKVRKELEKLGIENDELETIQLNVEDVVQNWIRNPETFKTVREIMLDACKEMDTCVLCHKEELFRVQKNIEISGDDSEPTVEHENVIESKQWKEKNDQLAVMNVDMVSANELLQAENARQKVDISTLGSQITSLHTQQVALQLANSQLATEKDVLIKEVGHFKQQLSATSNDLITLQCLHEQLSSEYEALNKEKELSKTSLRDARTEIRDLRERESSYIAQVEELQNQIAKIRKDNENFVNLRVEHSKLKDDFRNVLSANERLKTEYKNIQEQYKIFRSENGRLKLQNTELSGELMASTEQIKSYEIEYANCSNRCEMLMQINTTLDVDRRKLMDHVSQILTQYQELLTHSLDDKQHFHDEEKQFTDKVNHLHRQKEKLEEKIMEHYKKLESCSPKKKPFGANFYKKVKKASSDLINKVPSRHRRALNETDDFQVNHSESGGNESDNSVEEPLSVASDTNLLQRSNVVRRSLQRKSNIETTMLARGGVRSSFQSLKRESTPNRIAHRNSIHGLEPPDVTGSSLTLGTAGSRKTVYLIDEKLSASQSNIVTDPNPTTSNNETNSQIADSTPSTFLMYNKISNIYGTPVDGASGSGYMSDKSRSKEKKKTNEEKNKDSAIWYEYGCV